jgi:hypothetical protein
VNASIKFLRFWMKLKLELQHAFGALFIHYRGSPTILHRYESKVFENGHKREILIQRIPKETGGQTTTKKMDIPNTSKPKMDRDQRCLILSQTSQKSRHMYHKQTSSPDHTIAKTVTTKASFNHEGHIVISVHKLLV